RYWDLVKQNQGQLWCVNGKDYGSVNLGNKGLMTMLAGLIGYSLDGWDGLMLDVWCPGISGIVAGDCTYDVKKMGSPDAADFERNLNWMAENSSWWMPEYGVDLKTAKAVGVEGKHWLGGPLGPYSFDGHCYSRAFEHGLVIVNPTSTSQLVRVPAGYRGIVASL